MRSLYFNALKIIIKTFTGIFDASATDSMESECTCIYISSGWKRALNQQMNHEDRGSPARLQMSGLYLVITLYLVKRNLEEVAWSWLSFVLKTIDRQS